MEHVYLGRVEARNYGHGVIGALVDVVLVIKDSGGIAIGLKPASSNVLVLIHKHGTRRRHSGVQQH